jgi:hypothetical protein
MLKVLPEYKHTLKRENTNIVKGNDLMKTKYPQLLARVFSP